jgi:hypothetical protein
MDCVLIPAGANYQSRMATDIKIMRAIARLQRAMPRNPDGQTRSPRVPT